MTVWQKLSNLKLESRTGFSVFRAAEYHTCFLCMPEGTTCESRADVFFDGQHRLAFRFCSSGQYSVYAISKTARAKRVTIPAQVRDQIPPGTHHVEMTEEDGMLILDLRQFTPEGARDA